MSTPTDCDLSAWLLTRDELLGSWAGATRLKRLGSGGEAGYATEATLTLDKGRMRVSGICTSEELDRSREIVRAKGLDVSDHERNPLATVSHGWRSAEGVVGRCEVGGQYTVRPGAEAGNATPFATQFFQSGPNAERAAQAFEMVDCGVLRGVSIGFIIQPGGAQKVIAPDNYPALEITRAKMFELSFVPVADNPAAVVRLVEKGLGGRRLLPEFDAMLRPMLPALKAQVTSGYSREKNMVPATQPNPAAAQQQPDPAQQQQPAEVAPAVPPSAQFCSDLNTYLVGLLKFTKQAGTTQEHPAIKLLIPQVQLFISQAFRAVQQSYAGLQAETPDVPTLPGAGSLLVADPAAARPAGGAGAGMGGEELGDEDLGGGEELRFDDEFDDGGDDLDEDFDLLDEDEDLEDDEEEDEDPGRAKMLRLKRAAMAERSQRVIDEFWGHFARELDGTDALRLKRLGELAGKPVLRPRERKELAGLAGRLREKAMGANPQLREKAARADEVDAAAFAKAVADAVAPIAEKVGKTQDELFRLTGRGA